ncbi:phosphatidate cytidylyltransferase [Marinomonas sp.]
MLVPRIISAVIMALLFICAVFILEESSFVLAMGGVVIVAAWEWARLAGVHKAYGRLGFALVVAVCCYLLESFNWPRLSLYISPLLWLLALFWVIRYPDQLVWRHVAVRLLFGALVLLTTWSALVVLKQSDNFVVWVLVLMGLIWGADTGAYFAGRAFGRRKLARFVSPGKSWEGVFGGLLMTQCGIGLFAVMSHFTLNEWLILTLVALVTSSVSVLGDLTESLFKRHEGLKDSSKLIPGHGGVMDRVDSLTAAAPIFVLFLILVGWL